MSVGKLNEKLTDEITGNFIVESYQRGYRWTDREVKRLLDDIYSVMKNSERKADSYCLQPVVVKNLDDDNFELIDGQQRLTTLFLLYQYMYKNRRDTFDPPKFSLNYRTRKDSADFLKNTDFNRREENIDFHFIADAYETIGNWFETKAESKSTQSRLMINMNGMLQEKVKVIWYEVDSDENSTDLFTRLNIGKIPLTSAELVKAMFLSSKNIPDSKRDEIALQWDNIEKELHNESFWSFLNGNGGENFGTRIDIVLNLPVKEKSADKYSTFFWYEKLRAEGKDLNKVWEEDIVKNFLLLKDWYENHEFYHKIGFLITSGSKTLQQIYNASENKTKSDFSTELDKMIRKEVEMTGDKKTGDKKFYSELRYGNDNAKIKKILLLFNVESVRQNGEQSQRFAFDKFNFGNVGKNIWSLEHINPVNPQERGKQEQWRDWLKLHLKILRKNENEHGDLIDEINKLLNIKEIAGVRFEELKERILKKISPESMDDDSDDTIANLALLKCENNSALGNSVFEAKRDEIIRLDMNGEFIPFCTKMVFLKYYSDSSDNRPNFWTTEDRDFYIKAMNRVLEKYLSEPIDFSERG